MDRIDRRTLVSELEDQALRLQEKIQERIGSRDRILRLHSIFQDSKKGFLERRDTKDCANPSSFINDASDKALLHNHIISHGSAILSPDLITSNNGFLLALNKQLNELIILDEEIYQLIHSLESRLSSEKAFR
jgi:hypothetical protein